ncbi:hypothetical protein ACFYM5_14830 [Streptomyces sp. NPDC006706]|uniref:hypothetical protein n=1 Tax=Streptomyces sp. NPDC006706 TaxID=3364761 RepID=UPI00367DFD63
MRPALQQAGSPAGRLSGRPARAAGPSVESGMSLGALGGGHGLDLEVAAAGNTEVVRAKTRTLATLGMNDSIEDILVTLGEQYHLIRPLNSSDGSLFLYLAFDRSRGNPALARHSLKRIEATLEI